MKFDSTFEHLLDWPETFLCPGCGIAPFWMGADDDHPELCDLCWCQQAQDEEEVE